jgi:hypothetical protein
MTTVIAYHIALLNVSFELLLNIATHQPSAKNVYDTKSKLLRP